MLQKRKHLFFLLTTLYFITVSFAQLNNNEKNRKETLLHQTNRFEKKAIDATNSYNKDLEKRVIVEVEKNRTERVAIKFVVGGLILVLIFASYIFHSLRIVRKQKSIIEKQKIQVEQQKQLMEIHQKEIIASITYAMRIQQSLLPTEKYIQRTLIRLNKDK